MICVELISQSRDRSPNFECNGFTTLTLLAQFDYNSICFQVIGI